MGGRRLKSNGETRNLHVNSIKGTTHFNHAAAGYFLRLHDLMKTTTHGVDQKRAQRVVRTWVSNVLFLPQRLTQLDTVNSRAKLYFGIRRHSVDAVWRKTKPMINYYHFNGPVLGRTGSYREEFGRLQNRSWLLSALWNCIKFQFSACNVMASICHPSRAFLKIIIIGGQSWKTCRPHVPVTELLLLCRHFCHLHPRFCTFAIVRI